MALAPAGFRFDAPLVPRFVAFDSIGAVGAAAGVVALAAAPPDGAVPAAFFAGARRTAVRVGLAALVAVALVAVVLLAVALAGAALAEAALVVAVFAGARRVEVALAGVALEAAFRAGVALAGAAFRADVALAVVVARVRVDPVRGAAGTVTSFDCCRPGLGVGKIGCRAILVRSPWRAVKCTAGARPETDLDTLTGMTAAPPPAHPVDPTDTAGTNLLHGPLHDIHVEMGANFAEFGGWDMPVAFGGTVGEHLAVRETVGVFDVSHLGKASVSGPGAAAFINSQLSNDLNKVGPGKAQYTLCTVESGGVLDDLIVYYLSEDELFLIPNASNTAAVVAQLAAAAPADIAVTNRHFDYGVIAVQGPKSTEVLTALGLPTGMEYMAFADATVVVPGESGAQEIPVRVCRTGYTGEHGYELVPAWADSAPLYRALLTAVQAAGGQPAGLGARDTLRTEMGYPLHGHELSLDITPVQAGAGWAVGWKKDTFVGKEALVAEKAAGPVRKLYGLRATGRGVLRPELEVHGADGVVLGVTTSGTFSPSLKVGIALALLDSSVTVGDSVTAIVRGRGIECEVVKPPFVAARTSG